MHLRFRLLFLLALVLPSSAFAIDQERVCSRVIRNFQGKALLRVNERLERRLGFRCTVETAPQETPAEMPVTTPPPLVTPPVWDDSGMEKKISTKQQELMRYLTNGIWTKKEGSDLFAPADVYKFYLLAQTYTFRLVHTDTALTPVSEAGRWYVTDEADGVHLLLVRTDGLPCEALPCETIIFYDDRYDKLTVTDPATGKSITLDHQRK